MDFKSMENGPNKIETKGNYGIAWKIKEDGTLGSDNQIGSSVLVLDNKIYYNPDSSLGGVAYDRNGNPKEIPDNIEGSELENFKSKYHIKNEQALQSGDEIINEQVTIGSHTGYKTKNGYFIKITN